MTDLSELIERVERLDGPDTLADQAIYEALSPPYDGEDIESLPPERARELSEWAFRRRDYTASLDAAIALCERVLPDNSAWSVNWCGTAAVSTDANGIIGAEAATPAIALVLALLRALSREA